MNDQCIADQDRLTSAEATCVNERIRKRVEKEKKAKVIAAKKAAIKQLRKQKKRKRSKSSSNSSDSTDSDKPDPNARGSKD
jgi:hypothetical protein